MILNCLFLFAVTAYSEDLLAQKPTYTFEVKGNDVSTEYQKTFEQIPTTNLDPMIEELRNYRFLLVPGFFSNNIIALKDLPFASRFHLGEQFVDTIRWCEKNQIEVKMANIESEAEPAFNAKMIRDEILQSEKPIFLITQSKGSFDSLTALIEFPELRKNVRAFLPLNAPFFGTPLANDAMFSSHGNQWMNKFLELLGGNIKSVESLRVEESTKFINDHMKEISEIQSEIPLVALAARIKNKKKIWDTNFELIRNWLEYRGYENDGLLPWQSSVLPHSDYVLLDGIDHATSIRHSKPIPFDRDRFLATMLTMLRKRTTVGHF